MRKDEVEFIRAETKIIRYFLTKKKCQGKKYEKGRFFCFDVKTEEIRGGHDQPSQPQDHDSRPGAIGPGST